VLVYGSRAKGNYKNGSDIDLTMTGGLLSLSELMKVEALENSDLLDHINRVGVTIYRKSKEAV